MKKPITFKDTNGEEYGAFYEIINDRIIITTYSFWGAVELSFLRSELEAKLTEVLKEINNGASDGLQVRQM